MVNRPDSLRNKVAHGAALMVAQSVGAKVVGFACQIGIAWYLNPDQIGLVGLTMSVILVISVSQNTAMRTVLVHRQSEIDKLQNAAFWLSLVVGIAGMALAMLLAPVAAWLYGEKQLLSLCMVGGIALLLYPLGAVNQAILQSRLRFRAVAAISAAETLLYQPVSLLLAWWGWGAMSYILAWVVVGAARALLGGLLSRIALRPTPQFGLWPALLRSSGLVIVAKLLQTLVTQVNYIVLGLFFAQSAAGYFYFAYNLAIQPFILFAQNLETVLFPALAHLASDPERQREAFADAMRALALIVFPFSFIGAACAVPLIEALFEPKWLPAAGIFQVLCLGIPFSALGNTGLSLLLARGGFRVYLTTMAISLVGISAGVLAVTPFCTTETAPMANASVVTVLYFVQGIALVRLATRPKPLSLGEVHRIVTRPAVLSAIASAAGWLLSAALRHRVGPLLLAVATAALSLLLTAALFALFARKHWSAIMGRFALKRGATAFVAKD